jgi:hypothetical protein
MVPDSVFGGHCALTAVPCKIGELAEKFAHPILAERSFKRDVRTGKRRDTLSILRRSWWSLMWLAVGLTLLVMTGKQWLASEWSGNFILSFTIGVSISGAAVSRFVSENSSPRIARSLNSVLLPLAFVLVVCLFAFPFLGWYR